MRSKFLEWKNGSAWVPLFLCGALTSRSPAPARFHTRKAAAAAADVEILCQDFGYGC